MVMVAVGVVDRELVRDDGIIPLESVRITDPVVLQLGVHLIITF